MKKESVLQGRELELPLYKGPLEDRPEEGSPYGYAAWSRVALTGDNGQIPKPSPSCEAGMAYKGIDSATGLYRFALARPHQGKDYYEGASGVPIADPTGKILSIVVGKSAGEDFLLGLSLADYSGLVGLE